MRSSVHNAHTAFSSSPPTTYRCENCRCAGRSITGRGLTKNLSIPFGKICFGGHPEPWQIEGRCTKIHHALSRRNVTVLNGDDVIKDGELDALPFSTEHILNRHPTARPERGQAEQPTQKPTLIGGEPKSQLPGDFPQLGVPLFLRPEPAQGPPDDPDENTRGQCKDLDKDTENPHRVTGSITQEQAQHNHETSRGIRSQLHLVHPDLGHRETQVSLYASRGRQTSTDLHASPPCTRGVHSPQAAQSAHGVFRPGWLLTLRQTTRGLGPWGA